MEDAIDNEYLVRVDVQIINTNRLPLSCNAMELEWHAELMSITAKPPPCLLDPSSWAEPRLGKINASDPHFRWPTRPYR